MKQEEVLAILKLQNSTENKRMATTAIINVFDSCVFPKATSRYMNVRKIASFELHQQGPQLAEDSEIGKLTCQDCIRLA